MTYERSKFHGTKMRLAASLLPVLLAMRANSAHAVDCGPYKIVSIQAQPGDVLVRLIGGGADIWKSLGAWSAPATKPYLAIAQQAVAMDRSVFFRYGHPYVCGNTDYGTTPLMVRMDAMQ